MVATGACPTDTTAASLWPCAVACTNAEPVPTAVASPVVALTVTTAALVVDHVTGMPVRTAPPASRSTAVNCCVPPAVSDADGGETSTESTEVDAATVMVAESERGPLLAMMDVTPSLTAVTSPVFVTVATALLRLDQLTARGLLPGDASDAVSWTWSPTSSVYEVMPLGAVTRMLGSSGTRARASTGRLGSHAVATSVAGMEMASAMAMSHGGVVRGELRCMGGPPVVGDRRAQSGSV
jgi:hypothetical protein